MSYRNPKTWKTPHRCYHQRRPDTERLQRSRQGNSYPPLCVEHLLNCLRTFLQTSSSPLSLMRYHRLVSPFRTHPDQALHFSPVFLYGEVTKQHRDSSKHLLEISVKPIPLPAESLLDFLGERDRDGSHLAHY